MEREWTPALARILDIAPEDLPALCPRAVPKPLRIAAVRVGANARIGAHATILAGAAVPAGAVVGPYATRSSSASP